MQRRALFLTDDDRYRAMAARDPETEGVFVVAVRTTGIFCRPTCTSRTPLHKNVEFHATGWDAVAAGFRPCRRCRPMGVATERELVITRIETPIGTMVAAAVDEGIAVLDFADRRATRTALRNASARLRATADHRPQSAPRRRLPPSSASTSPAAAPRSISSSPAAERRSRNRSGHGSRPSRPAKPGATPTAPRPSAGRRRCGPSVAPTDGIRWPSSCPATGSSAPTAT